MSGITQTSIVGGQYRETAKSLGLAAGDKLPENTTVALDVDQTLIESKLDLGSGPFNFNLRRFLSDLKEEGYSFKTSNLKNRIILLTTINVPYETEKGLPEFIETLQNEGVSVLGETARKKKLFHVDLTRHTHQQLTSVGIHLENSYNPYTSKLEYYRCSQGVFFTEELERKGEYLINVFNCSKRPNFLIFGDDLKEHSDDVAQEMKKAGIPCHVFEYRPYLHSDNGGYRPFDLMTAAVQLNQLVFKHKLVEPWEAEKLSLSLKEKPVEYFKSVIKSIDQVGLYV